MKLKKVDKIFLFIACTLLIANYAYKNKQHIYALLNQANLELPAEKVDPTTEKSIIIGDDISQFVLQKSYNDSVLPRKFYYFQPPLLPKARLLKIEEIGDNLWFSGNSGLIRYNTKTHKWYNITRQHGLPHDTAYNIGRDYEDNLLIRTYNWSEKGHLTSGGKYIFQYGKFSQTQFPVKHFKREEFNAFTKDTPLKSQSDALRHNQVIWSTFRGKHIREIKDFVDGGVQRFDTETGERTIYTENDGLARDYSNSLTRAFDDSIWVAHWDEEAGLSVFEPNQGKWLKKRRSKNGIELGGVKVVAIKELIFIAQQRGLVIYDPIKETAILIDESLGLPGYIVADIILSKADQKTIWTTAYSLTGKGQRSAGLMQLNYDDIKALFATIE